MADENTTNSGGDSIGVTRDEGDIVSSTEMKQIITAMKTVLDHTHIFYDDYSRNCDCNCNCTRGTWG
jgi:hypothetical protein